VHAWSRRGPETGRRALEGALATALPLGARQSVVSRHDLVHEIGQQLFNTSDTTPNPHCSALLEQAAEQTREDLQ